MLCFNCSGPCNKKIAIIKNHIDNQTQARFSMLDLAVKHDLYVSSIKSASSVISDEKNWSRLNEMIVEYGFPTQKLIGKDAMQGVFLIIQHADGNKEWQKSQLPNLEKAALQGDLSKSNYAYLFDRIKVNSSLPQRYGSQFENVNKKMNIQFSKK